MPDETRTYTIFIDDNIYMEADEKSRPHDLAECVRKQIEAERNFYISQGMPPQHLPMPAIRVEENIAEPDEPVKDLGEPHFIAGPN